MDDQTLRDLFQNFGPIVIRRMFGGKGIYHQGIIFALVVDDELLLKADALSQDKFIAAGSKQWSYISKKSKKPVSMPYWSIDDAAFDDPELMKQWAELAFAAALRSQKSHS